MPYCLTILLRFSSQKKYQMCTAALLKEYPTCQTCKKCQIISHFCSNEYDNFDIRAPERFEQLNESL